MRSPKRFTLTAREVHNWALTSLRESLQLKDHGPKCTAKVVLSVLLFAASKVSSIAAACKLLSGAPTDQAVREALHEQLPDLEVLERRLNLSLCAHLPRRLTRQARDIAIDLLLIPYHGKPQADDDELYHSVARAGTTKFHAYASLYVTRRGFRTTLALTRVRGREKLARVVQRLVRRARQKGLQIRRLLLDRGFYAHDVIASLKRARVAFVMPVKVAGRKPRPGQPPKGLRAFFHMPNGWHSHVLVNAQGRSQRIEVCVASKRYQHRKSGRRRLKRLVYAAWGCHLSPASLRKLYRKRFGIESSYRQAHQARVRTCSRSPKLRLLLVVVALVLRNLWVWLHTELLAARGGERPRLRLGLLRFREMLHWIQDLVARAFQGNKIYRIELLN